MGVEQHEFHTVGQVTPRKDGVARVTGQEKYTVDISLPHMLHGRILASPYAHARITHIDASAAEALGAVVITWDDIPHVCYNERIITIPQVLHKDHYVLADKVRRMGEAVAAVAAETEELAEKAVRAIQVEYEVLSVLTDPIAAMQPGAEPIYDTVLWGAEETRIENNVACERTVEEGDVAQAFAAADVVVEGTFKTPKIYHAQMETKSVVCRPEPDGGLTVWPTTQSIHNVRILLGQIFDIPLSKINVIRVPIGGTFGSSIQMNPPIPICAALALKARRPVKLTLTREEDAHDHTRYGTQIHLKLAARRDGTLLGAEMDLVADIGAHNIQAYSFLGVSIGWLVSLYRLPNVRYHGTAVYTNKAISCAMQGFGNPQVTFAAESLMDELADRLGMDPVELRLKNYVGMGDTFWGQGPLVRSIVQSDGVPDLLRRGAEAIGWERRQPSGSQTGRYRRGIGVGRGFHTSSAGAPQPGDVIDFSGAMVKLNVDGSVDVITALMDHGGGTLEALAKLVAETLCTPLDKVNLAPGETCSTVYDCVTHATRGVYAGGGAAVKAAQSLRQEIFETAAHYLGVMPDALRLKLDPAVGQGVVYVPAIPERCMTLAELATRCWAESWKTIAAVESYRPVHCPPAYVTVFVEVEVDTWTGRVRTLKAVMGSDCGTVVNPDMAAGQLEGGLNKGAGYALYENNEWNADGQLTSKGYWIDAKTAAIGETPRNADLTVQFAHTYEPSGPLGAKGIGEAAMNPVAGAYANAVYNAIGVRFYELPITPEVILRALKEQGQGAGAMTDHQFTHQHQHQHEMTNSHLLAHEFDYYAPASLAEAVALLNEHDGRARLLAGGTNLVIWMKMEQLAPACVVDVGRIPGLDAVRPSDGGLTIGALTKIRALRNAPVVQSAYSALSEACAAFGSTQIQSMGTLGGNVCNGSPASDTVPALVAFGAQVALVGPAGERTLPVEKFLLGPGRVALESGELLTEVRLPRPQPGTGSAFIKLSRVAADLAKASAAAVIVREGDRVVDCRLAFGSVGPTVMRAPAAEALLRGQPFSPELALKAGEAASEAVSPIDDVRSTAWYRREVVKALTHDALVTAWARADESGSLGAWETVGEPVESRGAFHVLRGEQREITLTVNGVTHRLAVRPNELLLNVLRERLHLTGAKYGCGIGECGACTVWLDDQPALACLTLAVAADGSQVTTVEGLQGPNGELDPLQEAFIEHAAFQCGYCTPGMLMMTRKLLDEIPSPTEDDVRDQLKGNRCRCTGYASIVRAVQSCAK